MAKKRLDVILAEGGYAPSREKAKIMLMSGIVYVNGQREEKPGTTFDPQKCRIEVRGQTLPYVSRGGLKLEKALQVFPIDLAGRVCMDIGASTGGFTDCMLQNGAALVYAIDVGYGQLDWKLRSDPRVVCMEKTNFRYLKPEDLRRAMPTFASEPASSEAGLSGEFRGGEFSGKSRLAAAAATSEAGIAASAAMPTFASCDVSFISLSKILPGAAAILPDGGEMVCLIKPQFEAGREKVGKKGVVRDPAVHCEVIEQAIGHAGANAFDVSGLDFSPIRGPEGNIEYLMYLKKRPAAMYRAAFPAGPAAGEAAGSESAASAAGSSKSVSAPRTAAGGSDIAELVARSHAAFAAASS